MRILIFNWRDIKNPESGGAEVLTHEIAKRWAQLGHEVILFTSMFDHAPREELIDGVRILRKGHPDARFLFWSVHFLAFWEYKRNFEGNIDIVIDEIHGLPFFTPLYVRERRVALICEVANQLWFKVYGPIFGLLGRLVEILYLHLIYKNIPFLTISDSTKIELARNGIERKNITVIPMGTTKPKSGLNFKKEKKLTLIFVSRLTRNKGAEDAIFAFGEIIKIYPSANLWIVGRGNSSYEQYLKKLIKKSNIPNIKFFGYVDENKKFELMARAHILIVPSVKEGFGLTIPEAGLVGTPSVAYNVAGLSDVVVDKKTGILVNPSYIALASAVISLLDNKSIYRELQKNAKIFAKSFDFEDSAKATFAILKNL